MRHVPMRHVPMRDVPMRDVPALVGRTGDVRTGERTPRLRKRCHTPACFSLFPFCFLSLVFSPSLLLSLLALLLPQVFSFVQLNTINDLNLHSIQTFCRHPSHSTQLRKSQTVNHYLRIEYFQHRMQEHNQGSEWSTEDWLGPARPGQSLVYSDGGN